MTATTTTAAATASIFERNRRLYLDEESKLQSIVCDDQFLRSFQSWLDQTISQLDFQYEQCEQQLAELQQHVPAPKGSFWNSKAIIEHCNLQLAESRLKRRPRATANRDATGGGEEDEFEEERNTQQHAELPDLIQLIATLQKAKSHSFITPKQRRFVEQCETELQSVAFEPRELTYITNALKTKLTDDSNARNVFSNLASFQNTIEELSPDIDQCEQLLEASIVNGEMGLAEDISKRQLDVYEHVLRLITDQYPVVSDYYAESRNSDRRRRWMVFRMADRDITAVLEAKYRQIDACQEDMQKIEDQMRNYTGDDAQQRKRFEADKAESDQFLVQNKEKQQGVWNGIFGLFQELQSCESELATLSQLRRREVERRLQMEEREASRRGGHAGFLAAAKAHAQRLQDTIDNAAAARDIATALNDFVLDGCDSIAAKYDKQQNALAEMLRLVQKHHFKRFSDYYIAASRYLYRKERRVEQMDEEMRSNEMQREMLTDSLNPQAKEFAAANERLSRQRYGVAQEVMHVRHKLEKAERAVTPTLRSLDFAKVAYVHPREIVAKMNVSRWSTMLDYRSILNPPGSIEATAALEQEAATIEALRTELHAQKASSPRGQQRSLRGRGSVAGASPTQNSRGRDDSEMGMRVGGDFGGLCSAMDPYAAVSKKSGADHSRHGQPASQPQSPPSRFVERVHAMLQRDMQRTDTYPMPASLSSSVASSSPTGAVSGVSSPLRSPQQQRCVTASRGRDGITTTPSSSALAASPRRFEGVTFQAAFSYRARAPDELTFEVGQQIICVSRAQEEGWFRGICNQRTGLFPINYVEPMGDPTSTA